MFTLHLPPKILSKNLFYVAEGAVRVQSQLSKIVSEVAQRLARSSCFAFCWTAVFSSLAPQHGMASFKSNCICMLYMRK